MTPPPAPYLCAVCNAPVVAGARFCAHCGTPFSERPPLRVAPAVPPAPRVPATPPVAPGRPAEFPGAAYTAPPEKSTAALWIGGVVVLFVAALVGAYLLFARPVDRPAVLPEDTAREAPSGRGATLPPPVVTDEDIADDLFPGVDDVADLDTLDRVPPAFDGASVEDDAAAERDAERQAEAQRAAEEQAEREAAEQDRREAEEDPPPSPQLGAAWNAYQGALSAYQQAVRAAGSSSKSHAEIAATCSRLVAAGDAVLRLPGRERYAGQIARDRRNC